MAAVRSTVVVVTWRGRDHLGACLAALAAQTREHRVMVVDNASTDGSSGIAAGFGVPAVRMARNVGYAGALAAVEVDTEFVCWLNDDAVVEPGWLAALEDVLDADPRMAAAGGTLITGDGAVQSRGVGLTRHGYGRDVVFGVPFGFCGGSAILRMSAMREVGGVAGRFFCYYEDTDLSWRLRLAGWTIGSVPEARAVHLHGASSGLGSAVFHRWNERNRLWMLFRCAPSLIAWRELGRFAVLTLVFTARRLLGVPVVRAGNFDVTLRLGVLASVLWSLPRVWGERVRISRRVSVSRRVVWDQWAGRS